MKKFWQTLFHKLTAALRDRLEIVLAVMALRHQLAVLERSGKRPHFSPADRCFWVLLATIGADADLARRLYTSYVKVMSALPLWLSSWTTRGGQRSSRCDLVSCSQRSDPASVLFVWAPDILDRVGVPARSPPDFQSPDHDVPVPASMPRAVGTAHVCLASPPIECWGVHLFLHRQGDRPTTGQARGASRQVAA